MQLDVKRKDKKKSVINVAIIAYLPGSSPSRLLLLRALRELHGTINRESAVVIEHVTDW
jgi:hypothetical protein